MLHGESPASVRASDGPVTVSPSSTPWDNAEPQPRRFDPRASVILIGIPGAGKKSLGFIAATHLKRRLCTENHFFETETGMTKAMFLQSHGREALLSRSSHILQQILERNTRDYVIECGSNSLTNSSRHVLAAYAQTHPVIHIVRDVAEVISFCRLSPEDAPRLHRTDSGHRSCSNFEFFNVFDASTTADVHHERSKTLDSSSPPLILQKTRLAFTGFLDAILGASDPRQDNPFYNSRLNCTSRRRSFVTTLQLSHLVDGTQLLSSSLESIDAIEFVVDRWHANTPDEASQCVAQIRHHHNTPVIYSVDNKIPGLTPRDYRDAVAHGLRLGVSAVVINGYAPRIMQEWLLAGRGHASALCHYDVDGTDSENRWRHSDRMAEYVSASDSAYDVVRLTQYATDRSDNQESQHFRISAELAHPMSPPLITYNLGPLGRSSKVYNAMLTPVILDAVDSAVNARGPETGNLTIRDITQALFTSFEYDPLHFYVFGLTTMAFSQSPAMYRAAFDAYGLAHDMTYRGVASIDELSEITRSSHFGGAAISYPFKEITFKACKQTSRHADVIGSANCIIPLRLLSRRDHVGLESQAAQRNKAGVSDGLYGENTDWLGFYHCIRRRQSPRNAMLSPKETAVVLGAGGSARAAVYALICLGYQNVYICNRTSRKAEQLAAHFNEWCKLGEKCNTQVRTIELASAPWPKGVAHPTAIVACVPTDADFALSDDWLDGSTGGVVAEIAYRQAKSLFLDQVKRKRTANRRHWSIIDGFDILFESAVVQFEFFTGYRPPRSKMAQALRMGDETMLDRAHMW